MDGRRAPGPTSRRASRPPTPAGQLETTAVLKTLNEWLQEGEQLYDAALGDYRNLETQLEELEQRLAAKLNEVNQIAQMMGKPPVEPAKRLTAEIIEAPD